MKAEWAVDADPSRRIVRVRMNGYFQKEDILAWARAHRAATGHFRPQPYIVLADMRGLRPLPPDAAALMGEEVAFDRAHGCACCVHISDHTVQRLQIARLARQVSPDDQITIDVESDEEAERVMDAASFALERTGTIDITRIVSST
jgi:hypothetical protein